MKSLRILTFGWIGMGAVALFDMVVNAPDQVVVAIVAITFLSSAAVFGLIRAGFERTAAVLFCLVVDLTFFLLYVLAHDLPASNRQALGETLGVTMIASGLGIVFAGALISPRAPIYFAVLNTLLLHLVIHPMVPGSGMSLSAPVVWSLLALSIWLFAALIERMVRAQENVRQILEKSVRRLSENTALLDLASDAIYIEDANGIVRYWNQGAERIYGMNAQSAVGKRFDELIENESRHSRVEAADHLARHGHWEGETCHRRPDGKDLSIVSRRSLKRDAGGGLQSTLVINSDVTEKRAQESRLAFLAEHNLLTGLPAQRLLMDRFRQAIQRARREGRLLAFFFLDLDRFKTINAGLGLHVGDAVLQIAAERMQRAIGPANSLGYLAGDTFGMVIESCATREDIGQLADAIQREVAEPMQAAGETVSLTVSIGIALMGEIENAEDLFRGANSALHTAKDQGGNRARFFDPELDARHHRARALEDALRGVLERAELQLVYQPRVDTSSGRIIGVEALLRWASPQYGDVGPSEFIPLAEASGAIVPIGRWVLEAACRQAREWELAGHDGLVMAVNISARQLQEDGAFDDIAQTLAKTGLAPEHLELEITESSIMQNVEQMIALLERLSLTGIAISIDDFGTGYSSLSYLKRFPVQLLKIDQSFTHDLTRNPGDASLVATIIDLARNFGMRAVAEGVETMEQYEHLKFLKCAECQGYFFSKPVPPARIAEMLDAQRNRPSETTEAGVE